MYKKLPTLVTTLLIAGAIFLTWLLQYPYMLWAKEANGFYAWTADYFHWIWFEHLPFASTFAGDWLTQFFRFPVAGALIQALLPLIAFFAVLVLLRHFRAPRWLDALATIAVIALWVKQFGEESLVFSMPYVWFFLALALAVCLPRWWRIAVVLLGLFFLPVNVYIGWLVAAMLLVVLDRWLARRRGEAEPQEAASLLPWFTTLFSAGLLAGTFFYLSHDEAIRKQERLDNIQFLAFTDRWDALSDMICNQQTYDNVELPYMLLALSHQDRLGDEIFHYPINTEDYFLYYGIGTRDAYFFNQLFYSQIGYYNEAIHMAYQEKTRTRYPMSFRILMSLVKLETAIGDYRQADKYCTLLNQATCYHAWVQKHRPTAEQIASTDTKTNEATFFITDSTLKNLYYGVSMGSDNKALHDYYLCALLIRKNLLAFVRDFDESFDLYADNVPIHFWEALVLADAQGFHTDHLTMFPGLHDHFMDFQSLLGAQDKQSIMQRYSDTYWFNYYFLTLPEDQDQNVGIVRREQ